MNFSPSNSFQPNIDDDEVVPISLVEENISVSRDELTMGEDGSYAVSKAVEFFMRLMAQSGSHSGYTSISYDSIVNVINSFNTATLKEFFPDRIPYRNIAEKVENARNDEDS